MSARAYQAQGRGETIAYTIGVASVGHVLVACTTRGVCAVLLGEVPDALVAALAAEFVEATIERSVELEPVVSQVVRSVDVGRPLPDLPLDLRGTAFQHRVWQALRGIPRGQTRTYSQLAKEIGAPRAARAVGAACAANRLALLVPCHRVVRGSGELGGFRWGLDVKRQLLAVEKEDEPVPPGDPDLRRDNP